MQQQGSTNADIKFVGKRIEVLSKCFDEDGEVLAVWEKAEVVTIPVMKEKKQHQKKSGQQKRGKRTKKKCFWAIVMWEEEYTDVGAVNPTKKKLLKSMWNKHVEVA